MEKNCKRVLAYQLAKQVNTKNLTSIAGGCLLTYQATRYWTNFNPRTVDSIDDAPSDV
ncbi:Uncharacterised protein (plasmid) [Legionella adelaidensis]|uniref:Uncharacterized protein n=1 Tax=Legionella adelaidensis TaxID=45056 RepID=A0A0W0R1A6_9GAMM|nr:hypothetical protein [Legionella adelaidensis]KTC64813.1 hypothetical protein Lade_2107 [Legionella adelaidensis]VEH86197.1 Uncharacterised protein [Legionella adelaidensis]